ncbi:type II secretion system major pseudopilin GspG [Kordiimonas aquimaris]|uniref:type II secretion system major pseudopilin GspG n=1 Tax=Kordiimonas aquimaris TaxID=707591 RepID=UPI0021CEDF4C|nr:type II secretion system major pseudopilin GspG [Kordiimonas aquimaris]
MKKRNVNSQSGETDAGFTLLEILVVLTIVGLLATLVAPKVTKYLSGAKSSTASAQMASIAQALELYRLEVGSLPSTEAGLQALLVRPANRRRWNGPYLERPSALLDPWGNSYQYRVPGETGEFDLLSLGADNQLEGSGDDQDIWYR